MTLCLIINVTEYLQNHFFRNIFPESSSAIRILPNIYDGTFAKIINGIRPLNTPLNMFLESQMEKTTKVIHLSSSPEGTFYFEEKYF